MTLSSQQIAIILGSVTIGLLLLLFLVYVIVQRRSRHQKYKQSGNDSEESRCVGAVESQAESLSNPSRFSVSDPLITSDAESQHSRDDSSSLYSRASASASAYFSRSSLETVKAPPVPPIPAHFLPTRSPTTLPEDTVDIVTAPIPDKEDTIPKLFLPPLPSIKLSISEGNGEEEEEDKSQIYNVAKLLQSRQAKLRKDDVSRNTSMVSHIERSGSINVVLTPTEEEGSESYRPRYNRLKQKKEYNKGSSSPSLNLSTQDPISLSTLSIPNSQLGS
jgi:hypothetical protein